MTLRRSHVGTYLLEEGARELEQRVDFRAPFVQRMRAFLRSHPDEFYLPGIAVLTLTIVLGVVLLLTDPSTPLGLMSAFYPGRIIAEFTKCGSDRELSGDTSAARADSSQTRFLRRPSCRLRHYGSDSDPALEREAGAAISR